MAKRKNENEATELKPEAAAPESEAPADGEAPEAAEDAAPEQESSTSSDAVTETVPPPEDSSNDFSTGVPNDSGTAVTDPADPVDSSMSTNPMAQDEHAPSPPGLRLPDDYNHSAKDMAALKRELDETRAALRFIGYHLEEPLRTTFQSTFPKL